MPPKRASCGATDKLEIERTFLLSRMPPVPSGAEVLHIEQGYLPVLAAQRDHSEPIEGRLRRIKASSGAVAFVHTIKHGEGLVRKEVERAISADEYERWWPRTAGRRLSKTRYCVREAGGTWEIDDFHDLDLVLAEIELPTADQRVLPPAWLAPFIVRDVTDEKQYRNYELALALGRERSDSSSDKGAQRTCDDSC